TSLKLKGASSNELYLACGTTGESSVCQPTDSRGETYTETCPGATSSTLGRRTYTWDYTSCKYILNDTCSYAKRYLTYPNNCLRYVDKNGQCVKFLTAPQVPNPVVPCNLAYAGLLNCYPSNVHTTLPSGCSAGQPCDSCEIGHQYVYGIDVNGSHYPHQAYCGGYSQGGQSGTAYVVTTVQCYEGTNAPTQTNLNCLTGTGSGGGTTGPIIAPGN
ncbi:MAG: hypothetical protein Q4P84_06385, partial [Elusimicrobiales bacterium]|nr:hypothetical protein [Elusimicrobiales bacterium]